MKGDCNMSLHKEGEGIWKVRWREAGRHRSLRVHGPYELAKKIERKKLAARDENRHLDVKKEISFRMSALLDRYEQQYARKKKSYDREKSILAGIRQARTSGLRPGLPGGRNRMSSISATASCGRWTARPCSVGICISARRRAFQRARP